MSKTRRNFLKVSSMASAGLALGLNQVKANTYNNILGANERVNVAVVGLNSRGGGLLNTIMGLKNTNVVALCDVDSNVLDRWKGPVKEKTGKKVKLQKDFRKLLENKSIDAVFIASADHTHAPFSIYALQAGKHVYCEKPCSHNAAEGELLVAAQKRYGKLVQIGNQQRSAPTSQLAMKEIADGIIGEVYDATAWYANSRGTIGNGKKVAVPDNLDWDLWQGPAPRRDYMDNYVHYNWHWFRHWGTGEICNNGLHEMDICRWALGVDQPIKVISQGGRNHFKDDDWEFFDTQIVRFEYEGGKSFTWDGRSCNGLAPYGWGRGSVIYGTEGSIRIDRNDYFVYDRTGKEVKHETEKEVSQTTNILGIGSLTDYHIQNFFDGIRTGEKLNSRVSEANISNHLCHLGNISQYLETAIDIDPKTGKIVNNLAANKFWGREYEPGWEPKVD